MTTDRLQEKISSIVSLQLPEHIREDYPIFVAFLKAYYRYIEQDTYAQEVIQNAKMYDDIDQTISSFIQYFLNQYCKDIPLSILSDKKLLVKYINDIYTSKGSEQSYEILFRLLFNKAINIFYPSSQILRASDGKWKQRNSIFVSVVFGDVQSITNKVVTVINQNYQYPLKIINVRSAFSSDGASSTIYELFIDNNKNIPINVDDTIVINGFQGTVVPIPNTISIINEGVGFRVGDIFTLRSDQGDRLKVKVIRVTDTGGVRNLQIVSFGIGYSSDFYNSFTADTLEQVATDFSFDGSLIRIRDSVGFIEEGTILRSNYSVGYFSDDYVGTIAGSFYTNTTASEGGSTGSPNDCTLFVQLGSIARYAGYYETNDGFLSDTIYLQDADYYQPFSYVIKIDEQLNTYKNVVLDMLHPAGMKMFGEYILENDVDVSSNVTALFRLIYNNIHDVINITDSVGIDFNAATKYEDISVLEAYSSLISKNIFDTLIVEDEFDATLNAGLSDTETAIENINIHTTIYPSNIDGVMPLDYIYATDYFGEDYVYVENTIFMNDQITIQFI